MSESEKTVAESLKRMVSLFPERNTIVIPVYPPNRYVADPPLAWDSCQRRTYSKRKAIISRTVYPDTILVVGNVAKIGGLNCLVANVAPVPGGTDLMVTVWVEDETDGSE